MGGLWTRAIQSTVAGADTYLSALLRVAEVPRDIHHCGARTLDAHSIFLAELLMVHALFNLAERPRTATTSAFLAFG